MKRLQFLGVVQHGNKNIHTYWNILFPYVKIEAHPIFGVAPAGKFAQIMRIPDHNFEGTKAQQLTLLWNAPYGHMVYRNIIYNGNNFFAVAY